MGMPISVNLRKSSVCQRVVQAEDKLRSAALILG